MIDVFAGHLPGLGPKLERVHADGAMAVFPDVVVDDLYGRHRLDGGLRCWRVLAPPSSTDAIDLDLGELLEQAVEARAH